ncbi:MAG: glycosyltransferase family 2 protein [Burkholderiales bacterium]|nr:glycosyltransferase family 2 protein [Burkholderiales bacterium]
MNESNLPLVTVIVPCYNHEKYVETCLDSIFRQTYKNIEVIVVDDYSKDNSTQVINEVNKKYNFKFIKHTENWGLTKTLNDVIYNHANGKYIKCIASDDFLTDECVELLTNEIEKNGNSFAFVYGKAQTFFYDKSGDVIEKDIIGKPTDFLGLYTQRENLIPAMSVLFNRMHFIEVLGFDESIYIEDFYIWLTLASKYHFGFVPIVVAYYQINVGTSMSKNNIEMKSAQILILTSIFNLNKDKIPPEVYFYEVSRQPVLYAESEIYFLLKKNQRILSLKKYVLNLYSFIKYRRVRLITTFFPKLILSYFR